jgi:hypothetical protein
MQPISTPPASLIDYFRRENASYSEMVFNRLGFFDRLVLYWPHIGLITQSTRGMGLMSTQRSTQRSTAIAAAVTLALSGQTAAVLAAQSTSAGSNQQIE